MFYLLIFDFFILVVCRFSLAYQVGFNTSRHMRVEDVAGDELCLVLDNFCYGAGHEPWFIIPSDVPRVPYNTLI